MFLESFFAKRFDDIKKFQRIPSSSKRDSPIIVVNDIVCISIFIFKNGIFITSEAVLVFDLICHIE